MNAASWLENLPAGERTRTLLLREGPRIATWVLAIALGVQAALILTDLAGAGRGATAGSVVGRAPSRAHSLDLAAITNAHLFGAAHAPRDHRAAGAARRGAATAAGHGAQPHERLQGIPWAQPRGVHAARAASRRSGDSHQRHPAR